MFRAVSNWLLIGPKSKVFSPSLDMAQVSSSVVVTRIVMSILLSANQAKT